MSASRDGRPGLGRRFDRRGPHRAGPRGSVEPAAPRDGLHVLARLVERDGLDEQRDVLAARLLPPLSRAAAAGVVAGERDLGMAELVEQPREVLRAIADVALRIDELLGRDLLVEPARD